MIDTLETALDWVPGSSSAALDRATDVFDFDFADAAGDVLEAAGDLVEAAGEGVIAAAAATEAASRATYDLFRRRPLIALLIAGAAVAAIALVVGKRHKGAQEDDSRSLHVAA